MRSASKTQLVRAQDRTTHAVRALGVYFIYSAFFNLSGGAILTITYISSINSYDGLSSGMPGFVFGGLVITAGSVTSLIKASRELALSNNWEGKKSSEVLDYEDDSLKSAKSASTMKAVLKSETRVPCTNCSTTNDKSAKVCSFCDRELS